MITTRVLFQTLSLQVTLPPNTAPTGMSSFSSKNVKFFFQQCQVFLPILISFETCRTRPANRWFPLVFLCQTLSSQVSLLSWSQFKLEYQLSLPTYQLFLPTYQLFLPTYQLSLPILIATEFIRRGIHSRSQTHIDDSRCTQSLRAFSLPIRLRYTQRWTFRHTSVRYM